MKIPAGDGDEVSVQLRLPEAFGDEVNDALFDLGVPVTPRRVAVLASVACRAKT